MKLKFRNKSAGAYGVNALRGTLDIAPDETATEEFTYGEALAIKNNHDVFEILEGWDESEAPKASEGEGESAAIIADLRKRLATAEADNKTLRAENDTLKTGGGSGNGNETKPTLAEAVASLDNANDEHWTEAGKPSLDVLKKITGNNDLKRAEVDALNIERKQA